MSVLTRTACGGVLIAGLLLLLVINPTARSQNPTQNKPQDKDDDVVRVNTELVVLNATVVGQDGKFVRGLKAGDFHVLEDGVEQKIASFGAEETPFAAAILLDTSGSMESRLTLGRSAAIRFLDGLRDEDVAAVYNFDVKVDQIQDYSPGRDLPAKAFGLKVKTLTRLNDAVLRAADDLAKREEKRRAIVVLSYGGEHYSHRTSDKALDHAMRANATIFAVNMGDQEGANRDLVAAGFLKNFTEKSGGRHIYKP